MYKTAFVIKLPLMDMFIVISEQRFVQFPAEYTQEWTHIHQESVIYGSEKVNFTLSESHSQYLQAFP